MEGTRVGHWGRSRLLTLAVAFALMGSVAAFLAVTMCLPRAAGAVAAFHEVELKWGETAEMEGGAVTVDIPALDRAAKSALPGFSVFNCVVTITNTGNTPISYSPRDFSVEGRLSGGTGSEARVLEGSQRALGTGMLPPGRTVTGSVRFNLYQNDTPVLVGLGVPWSEETRVNWH